MFLVNINTTLRNTFIELLHFVRFCITKIQNHFRSFHSFNGSLSNDDDFACEMKVTVAVTFLVGAIQVSFIIQNHAYCVTKTGNLADKAGPLAPDRGYSKLGS